MKTFEYIITDPIGLHARPCGLLVKEAKKYKSEILVHYNGKSVGATRLMVLMSLLAKHGETIKISVEGEDEEIACAEMMKFCESYL